MFRPGTDIHIAATAHHLPERKVSNEELIALTGLEVDADWIRERTGIEERRWAGEGLAVSDLVVPVVQNLCDEAGIRPDDLSRLIVATTSPDYPTPSTACVAQGKLGCTKMFPCLDVAASCTGFMYALDLGARCVETGEEYVAVVAAEMRSRFLNMKDRSTVVLFGDGAGGVLLSRKECTAPGREAVASLLATTVCADGSGAMTVYVPAGGSARPASAETVEKGEHGLLMADGAKVFVAAVEGMQMALSMVLEGAGFAASDLDILIPHQANGNMLAEVRRGLGAPGVEVIDMVARLGNTSSSSVPICLDRLHRAGRIRGGALVGLVAVGGGHTAGSALLRWR